MSKTAKTAGKIIVSEVWSGLKAEIPSLFQMLAPDGEVVLTGRHAEASVSIMKKIEEDALALKAGEISRAEFVELVRRRKDAIYALYSAEKVSRARPSDQKILGAVSRIIEVLVTRAVPVILALL